MKINFEDIFNTKKTSSFLNYVKNSQASTSRDVQSLFNSQANYPQIKNQKSTKQTYPNSVLNKNIKELIKKSQNQQATQYKYYKPSKIKNEIQQQQSPIQQKFDKAKIAQLISSVTQRLNKPTHCFKKRCKQIQAEAFQKYLKNNNFQFDQNQPKQTKRSLTQTCQILNKPSKLHNRLYWQFKQKEFKNMQLQNEYQQEYQKDKVMNILQKPQYLKNYRSFYERLDQQVTRRLKRDEYYAVNRKLGSGLNQKQSNFEPNTTASKKSLKFISQKPKITPKMQKNTLKGRAQMQVMHELSNTQNILRKKDKIISERQQKIIKNIANLFENDGETIITAEGIEKLNETQFNIFFPLLQQIEQTQISSSQFEQLIRQYLQVLPIPQKQQIRHLKKQANKKQDQKQQAIQTNRNGLKKVDKGNSYLKKLQNFI